MRYFTDVLWTFYRCQSWLLLALCSTTWLHFSPFVSAEKNCCISFVPANSNVVRVWTESKNQWENNCYYCLIVSYCWCLSLVVLCISVDLFLSALELTFANVFAAMSKLILKAVKAIFSRCHVWVCFLGGADHTPFLSKLGQAFPCLLLYKRFHDYL